MPPHMKMLQNFLALFARELYAPSETLFCFELADFRKGHISAYCSRSVSLEDTLEELELKFC